MKAQQCIYKTAWLCSLMGLVLSILTQGAWCQDPNAPATIMVRFHERLMPEERLQIIQGLGCTSADVCESAYLHHIIIPAGQTPSDMIDQFQNDPCVIYAELNYPMTMHLVPDDPFFHLQWNMGSLEQGGINLEPAWNIQEGDPNIVIAIVDTGIAYEDANGFMQAPDLDVTRFVQGYNFVESGQDPEDDNGHGTHVAGTIAQSTNNDLGVAGIAFNCSIMPVKVLDHNGVGDYFTTIQGIYYAVDHGANLINLSLGGTDDSQALQDAVIYAYDSNVTVVCSAGNEYLNGNPVTYPAGYQPYTIAVAATTLGLEHAFYSSSGDYVDIAAPGGDLTEDLNQDGYADGILQQTFQESPLEFHYWFFQGTSMAAPHITGVAALLYSNGVKTPDEVLSILSDSAVDLGSPGWDPEFGWGLVDALAALQASEPNVSPGGTM